MKSDLVLTNARIVGRDHVLGGTIRVVDGRIAEISDDQTCLPSSIDCEGDYIIPGLVELHTDNFERHINPRPKVRWHAGAAILAHDAQIAAAGITTVFDAIACGDILEGGERIANLDSMVNAISDAQKDGYLRADHRLHLRCEVSSETIVEIFSRYVEKPMVGIASLMDHAPGQRQFVHPEKYRTYYMGKYGMNDSEMDAFVKRQLEANARYSDPHRRAIADICASRGLTLASHDDATPEHVTEAVGLGVKFSEFPTTLEAAKSAREAGMKILMGAPNLVRGGSHSGNVSAAELAAAGHLDVLSSDYIPVSLLHAAFSLHNGPLAFSLPDAIATVTRHPAKVVALHDRGVIEPEKRADLVRVHDTGDVPVVRAVWVEGSRAA